MRKEETPPAASTTSGERKGNLSDSKSKLYNNYTSSVGRVSSRIVRVSSKKPCVVCGKDSWCYYPDDGAWAGCMRVQEGSVKQARNGNGYIHVLRDDHINRRQYVLNARETKQPFPPASAERRDAIYRDLLGKLPLRREHADDLLARGYSDSLIAARLFASMPDKATAAAVCEALVKQFGDIAGVPGFYPDGRRWRLNTHNQGVGIPYSDQHGRIRGIQIRRDAVSGGKNRYFWLSSASFDGGSSSGAPTHYARPELASGDGTVIVTEGALKADIIADRYDCATLAVPGVSSFAASFADELRAALPCVKTVLIAYDADWRENRNVCDALLRLMNLLEGAGLEVMMFDWDVALGKGLDDVLRHLESEVAP